MANVEKNEGRVGTNSMRPKVFTGTTYGRLLTIAKKSGHDSRQLWVCICKCGKSVVVRSDSLLAGKTVSCGCFSRENSRERGKFQFTKHGMCRTPEYRCWRNIRRRCYETKNNRFRYYGARGIQVCARWFIFDNFIADMGLKPSRKHSIDRRDNEGHYMPSNCLWATPSEQIRNRRPSIVDEFTALRILPWQRYELRKRKKQGEWRRLH